MKTKQIKNITYVPLSQYGYTMPAEWEKHAGTWLSYPHNPKSFFSRLSEAQDAFAKLVGIIAEGERVHVNVNDDGMEEDLKRRLVAHGVTKNVTLHHFPTNDAWCRDHGAIFLTKNQTSEVCELPKFGSGLMIATEWVFNSWGGKYPHDKDAEIAHKMANYLGVQGFSSPMVLEGGSLEVNGEGVLLTTESCLLNKNRNPELSRQEIEEILADVFGFQKILWLKDGILGDDTDGHIDDLSRFTDPETIVTVIEENKADDNFDVLQENLELLKTFKNQKGRPFKIATLPMPDPLYYDGERLPASYANFYICNAAVIVPTFGCSNDERALNILRDLFPQKRVIGIDASAVIVGLGTFHCLTQQVPVSS
jgi:agmatine deiminase